MHTYTYKQDNFKRTFEKKKENKSNIDSGL